VSFGFLRVFFATAAFAVFAIVLLLRHYSQR